MEKIFKCDRCGAYTYVSATPGTLYAQPQCDCGERMQNAEDVSSCGKRMRDLNDEEERNGGS